MSLNVYITKVSKYLPNLAIENDEMEQYVGMINQKPSKARAIVLRNNGIKKRYYAFKKDGEITNNNAELTALAIKKLFDEQFQLTDLELLVCGTTSPDQLLPSHAAMVHGYLGGNPLEIASFTGACCSSMQAFKFAYISILSGEKNNAICAGSELTSLWLHARNFKSNDENIDKLKCTPILAFEKEFLRWMLSDGAGAFLLQNKPSGPFSFKIEWIENISYANEIETCMYSGAIKQPDGELKGWKEIEQKQRNDSFIFALSQDTKLLEKNIARLGVKYILDIMSKRNFDLNTIDWFLPHLSSEFFKSKIVDELLVHNLSIPDQKWFMNLSSVGNVGAGSIFIAMEELYYSGNLKKEQKILLMVPESARFSYSFTLLTVV